MGVLLLLLSAALATASALAWTGRWRRWSGQLLLGGLPMPITLFPGLALGLASAALWQLEVVPLESPVTAVGVLAEVAGLALYVWAPPWWGPKWYRQGPERSRPHRHDGSAAAATVAMDDHSEARSASADRAFASREALERWEVTWVTGSEAGRRAHGLGRAGTADAVLELHAGGLAVRTTGAEDRLRGHALSLVVGADEIRGARRVPPGAGPTGRRRRSNDPRSALARRIVPRLVVDTVKGALVFEVYGARRKAERVRSIYGCPARPPGVTAEPREPDRSAVGPDAPTAGTIRPL